MFFQLFVLEIFFPRVNHRQKYCEIINKFSVKQKIKKLFLKIKVQTLKSIKYWIWGLHHFWMHPIFFLFPFQIFFSLHFSHHIFNIFPHVTARACFHRRMNINWCSECVCALYAFEILMKFSGGIFAKNYFWNILKYLITFSS